MLDTVVRPWIDRPLNYAGRLLAQRGVTANAVTFVGLAVGLLAATAIATAHFKAGLALIALNRVIDGLDGAVARVSQPTDIGGYLDIVVDYVFYSSIPLAFALANPAANAVAAAALLAAFCLTCSSFLTYAIIAGKRDLQSEAHGKKSFFFSIGLIEGTETIVFFLIMTAAPLWFPTLAWILSGLCVLTALQRSAQAIKLFS